MKKLMMTVAMATAMVAFGEEKCEGDACATKMPETAVEQRTEAAAIAKEAKRPSKEELAKRREERQRLMQARFEQMAAKQKEDVAKVLIESGLDEVKAKEAAEKIAKIYSHPTARQNMRPDRPNRKGPRPEKPVEAAPEQEAK